MKVLKFGGTSMGSVESLMQVSNIIGTQVDTEPCIVVCSAMSQVTNMLIKIGALAEQGKLEDAMELFSRIKRDHIDVAEEFQITNAFMSKTKELREEYASFIKGICRIHENSPRSKAYFVSLGERLSTRLLTCILNQQGVVATQCDSTFIKTKGENFREDSVDWEMSQESIKKSLQPILDSGSVPVITGFFGTNQKGLTFLLGRGGSDYSAAILAVGLGIQTVEIRTDVDGFMSADPRIVPEAKVLNDIGYEETAELCFFGAKVLHPKTIRPVIERNGDVWIKNTFSPKLKGTRICKDLGSDAGDVLSLSSKEVIILHVDLFGVPYTTKKTSLLSNIFSLLEKYDCPVDLIASSEAKISLCIDSKFGNLDSLIMHFQQVVPVQVQKERNIVAIVSSEKVRGRIGFSEKVFQAIAESHINVEMYSQNFAEIAQLLVVKSQDAKLAIQSIHQLLVT